MFTDLTDASIQPLSINIEIPEIILSSQIRKRLKDVFEKEEKTVRIYRATSIVQPDNNFVFFSNHWYYLAILCIKFARALYPYCEFFDENIRNNQEITRDIAAGEFNNRSFVNLFDNDIDKERMIKFIKGGSDFRPGKALLNNPDEKGVKTRSCKDIFGSCVLKKLAVPDASSGYLGTVIYYLAQHPNLYSDLETEINAIIQANKGKEIIIDNTIEEIKYSIDDLSDILREMYSHSKDSGQVAAIHMFAFKYGKYIIENKFSLNEIIIKSGIKNSFNAELNKGLNIYRSVNDNEYGVHFYKNDEISNSDVHHDDENEEIAVDGENRIYYGAPGCGKSRFVADKLRSANIKESNIIRITFHPEYSNVDFIGQILPTIETDENGSEIVKYIFNAGSFSIALLKAYNTTDMVYLVIEEINRGNAAAIFGDMFQLLDRVRDINKPDFNSSEYPVSNPNVQKYLIDHVENSEIKERLSNGIYIPSNLSILATMNSSDQSVFTLDTAFKRRWSFEQISNDINRDSTHVYKNWFVPGTNTTWAFFLTKINDTILDYKIHSQTNEDKRLGKYFVTQECLTENPEKITDVQNEAMAFAYKVLEYIWNDVCKIGREEWFNTDKYKTLEQLIEAFTNPIDGENPLSVFQNITFKE